VCVCDLFEVFEFRALSPTFAICILLRNYLS
jgi:hypothetical protein